MRGGILIVTPSAPSELVLSTLRKYIANPENPLVQIFEIRHLGFDIAQHRQVPAHKILKKDELDAFMKEYKLTNETVRLLPKIDCQDPMAKRIRARPGDVIEIRGLSLTSGEYRHARLCVEYTG
jgi:DNA-directed RNA polymerase subunit H (RpoH/RPB5)